LSSSFCSNLIDIISYSLNENHNPVSMIFSAAVSIAISIAVSMVIYIDMQDSKD